MTNAVLKERIILVHAVLHGLSPLWIRRETLARSWTQDRVKQDLGAELWSSMQSGCTRTVVRDAGCSSLTSSLFSSLALTVCHKA